MRFEDRSWETPPIEVHLPPEIPDPTARSMVWQSIPPSTVSIYDREYRWEGESRLFPRSLCRLIIDAQLWMSDTPEERLMMWAAAKALRGRKILVGGLGLGIFPQYAEFAQPGRMFTIVERSQEVINKVAPVLLERGINFEIVKADVREYIQKVQRRIWDSAYMDIWPGNPGQEGPRDRDALVKLIGRRGIIKGRTICWGHQWSADGPRSEEQDMTDKNEGPVPGSIEYFEQKVLVTAANIQVLADRRNKLLEESKKIEDQINQLNGSALALQNTASEIFGDEWKEATTRIQESLKKMAAMPPAPSQSAPKPPAKKKAVKKATKKKGSRSSK